MFKNLLPSHWNVFATTAANDQESSYACYMDELRNTYLGDVYSVMWMENSDQVDLERETLQNQFLIVQKETNTSHVQEFGDKSLRGLPVAQFLGEKEPERKRSLPKVPLDAVETSEVVTAILEHKLRHAKSPEENKNLQWRLRRHHKLRKLVQSEMEEIVSKVTENDEKETELVFNTKLSITNWDCYESAAKYFSDKCFSIAKNPYVTRKLYVLVNLCERGWSKASILQAMSSTCHHSSFVGIH
jgi:legumain